MHFILERNQWFSQIQYDAPAAMVVHRLRLDTFKLGLVLHFEKHVDLIQFAENTQSLIEAIDHTSFHVELKLKAVSDFEN